MLTKIDMKHKTTIDYEGYTITIIERPKGFGDTIEKILHTGTVGKLVHKLTGKDKPCGACEKRKNAMNTMLPYNNGGKNA